MSGVLVRNDSAEVGFQNPFVLVKRFLSLIMRLINIVD